MSSYRIRHQGSPQAVDGLTAPEITQGLLDGVWDPTDEVMAPAESTWTALENHPEFLETTLDIEPTPATPHDDETHLDMNALIDVTLVLLIFFILTTSYAALQKMLDLPGAAAAEGGTRGPRRVSKEQVERYMIRVEVRLDRGPGDKEIPAILVEGQPVALPDLVPALKKYVSDSRKTEMLLDHSPRVPHGVVVAIQDAARGAGIQQVHLLIPRDELKR